MSPGAQTSTPRHADSSNVTTKTGEQNSKRGALLAYYQPGQFQVTTPTTDHATYRWNTKLVAHHFCPACGCATFSDSPAFEPDGSWDKSTRRIGVNARLFDNFDAAEAPVVIVDGKNLW